jgi:paraquat-inducible protein B
MTDNTAGNVPENEIPEAAVKPRKGISIVWIIPIVAALIGAWVAYKSISEVGPTIVITFESAEGLVADKTRVKYKDVDVGLVKAVDLEDDLKHVEVTVQMQKGSRGYLTEKTRFWVVKARINAGTVSGLGTLLSGAYIAIDPVNGGEFVKDFVGLESVPVVTTHLPGQHFKLKAARRGSLDVGAPIYFRQIQVGEVVSYKLSEDGKTVNFEIFINAPHHLKVRENTRFWNASGIDVTLSAAGFNLDMESAVSLISGGLAFEVPPDVPPGDVAAADRVFTLFDDRTAAFQQKITVRNKFLLYFDGTVRGLAPDAPVEFRGIKLGRVISVDLEYDIDKQEFHIPVLIEIEPERFSTGFTNLTEAEHRSIKEEFIKRGLRAQLKTGNFLTGMLYVDLEFFPDAEVEEIRYVNGIEVLPTIPTSIQEITRNVTALLNKVKAVPFDKIGADMTQTLSHLDKTIIQAGDTLKSIDKTYAEDSAMARELQTSIRELAEAARSLRILADYLERHPEALLRGKEAQ